MSARPAGRPAKKPAKKKDSRAHIAVAETIGRQILKGDYAPGMLLPNEAEWCRKLKVGRSVIRESTKMLAAKGLVASRPRIGTRVEPREQWNLMDRDMLVWYAASRPTKQFLRAVQEMRYIFEPEAAAFAALNRTAAQMTAITTACQDMGAAATLDTRTEADVRFHLAILKAAGNELLVPFGMLIKSALETVFVTTTRKVRDLQYAQALHECIEVAVRKRRPNAARIAVRRLLANTDGILFAPAQRIRQPKPIDT